MGIALIITGIIFFLNPSIRMMDFLPDLLGCLFLIAGTSKLYVLDGRIENARKAVFYLTLVSALKTPASMYFPLKAKGYLLPFSFIFSVVEIILMIMLFVSLFGGLEYLTSRDSTKKGHGKRSGSASVTAFIFSIARGICSFAPELLVLGEQTDSFDYTFHPTPVQNAALIKPYAELLCFVLILVFGIYTGVILFQYLGSLLKDKEFICKLKERYAEYEKDNYQTFTQGRMKRAFIFTGVGILLLQNLILDGVNVLPNVIAYALLITGTLLIIRVSNDITFLKKLIIFIPLIPLSVHNTLLQKSLITDTDINIKGIDMIVKEVPEMLKDTKVLPKILAGISIEYILLGVFLCMLLVYIGNLRIVRENDTVSIFEILTFISALLFLISSVCVYFFPFVRTSYSYITEDINSYIRYDTIVAISEWVSYISFVLTVYFSYKHGSDILSRIKAEN